MPNRTARARRGAVVTVVALLASLLMSCGDSTSPSSEAPAPAVDPSLTVEYSPGLSEDIYLPALASGAFTEVEAVGSLRVLRRGAGDAGDPLA